MAIRISFSTASWLRSGSASRQPPGRRDPDHLLRQCASCTTNNITPLVEILDRHFGVEKALLATVHAYTATQALVDSPGGRQGLRRGCAAAQNFVPSSTGAATATAKALPAMQGRFDGVSVRGPVVVGSLVGPGVRAGAGHHV